MGSIPVEAQIFLATLASACCYIDHVCLQVDHNALHACNHNALQHLTSQILHILHEFSCTWQKPGVVSLGSLPEILDETAQQSLSVDMLVYYIICK